MANERMLWHQKSNGVVVIVAKVVDGSSSPKKSNAL
jgi:hypothetical protein